jgi:Tol biopolymer transport system component
MIQFLSHFARAKWQLGCTCLLTLVIACGGGTGGGTSSPIVAPPPPSNPLPSVTSISPITVISGRQNFQVTVKGSNFISSSTVRWNNSDRKTTFFGNNILGAEITSNDIAQTGVGHMTVSNPPPGGGESAIFDLIVLATNPVPQITSISPASMFAGSATSTLTVVGKDFTAASFIKLNGSGTSTDVISTTKLQTSIDYFTAPVPQQVDVTVFTSAPGGGTSATVPLPIIPGGTTAGQIDVVNTGTSTTNRFPTITPDGRFIAFLSDQAAGWDEVMVRDTCLGATPSCQPGTSLVSVAADGTVGNGDSGPPSISNDGRFIAFWSRATNLLPNTDQQVYLHDRDVSGIGVFDVPGNIANYVVSVGMDGKPANRGASDPSVSADGRFVAFDSASDNLVSGDTNNALDVFVRDTCLGADKTCSPQTVRASVATDGSQTLPQTGNLYSYQARLSATGRYVAFSSAAGNLAPGLPLGGVFVRDTCFSAPAGCTPRTTAVSIASNSTGSGFAAFPAISADGRFIPFVSALLLPEDVSDVQNIYLRDTCEGAAAGCIPNTVNVSLGLSGVQANAGSYVPAISPDGRFIGYQSAATNIAENNLNDTNRQPDFFVHDSCAGAPPGCIPRSLQVSIANDGTQSSGEQGVETPTNIALSSGISGGGPVAVFASSAINLVSNVTTGRNIYRVFTSF